MGWGEGLKEGLDCFVLVSVPRYGESGRVAESGGLAEYGGGGRGLCT